MKIMRRSWYRRRRRRRQRPLSPDQGRLEGCAAVERAELTSGSTWHAAGGMHTVNGDPNVAKLQQYTIKLYEEIEQISGQSCGVHITGGLMLAGTRERMDWLKMAQARGRYLGMELELLSVAEAAKLFPLHRREAFPRRACTIRSRATSIPTA